MNINELSQEYLAKLKLNIESKYKVTKSGCWEWTAQRNKQGYGQISVKHKWKYGAHRVYYQLVRGFINDGLVIDHEVCNNPPCINPDHLRAVTNWENTLRSNNIAANNARKTHCKHGHKFTPKNTINSVRKGRSQRNCRICVNQSTHRRDRRRTLEYHKKGLNSKGKPLQRKLDYRFTTAK